MQTIATSPTGRRGILIENLTVVSFCPRATHREQRLSTQEMANLKEQLDTLDVPTNVSYVKRRVHDVRGVDPVMYYKSTNGVEIPKFISSPDFTNHPEFIYSTEYISYPKFIYSTEVIHSWLPNLLILYGAESTRRSIMDELDKTTSFPITVVKDIKDIKDIEDLEYCKDHPLYLYEANHGEEMILFIKAANKAKMKVDFMGVDLFDMSEFSDSLNADNAEVKPTKNCFLRSDVETMIARVMDNHIHFMKRSKLFLKKKVYLPLWLRYRQPPPTTSKCVIRTPIQSNTCTKDRKANPKSVGDYVNLIKECAREGVQSQINSDDAVNYYDCQPIDDPNMSCMKGCAIM